jgi:uncharacterized protein (TIGR03067 family)
MRNHTSLGLILVLFIFASATFAGGDAKEDAKKVQGTWKVIRAQVDGKDVEAAELKDTKFIFKDDVITFHSLREKNTATFKLNVAKKPRRIDTEVLDGEAKLEPVHDPANGLRYQEG